MSTSRFDPRLHEYRHKRLIPNAALGRGQERVCPYPSIFGHFRGCVAQSSERFRIRLSSLVGWSPPWILLPVTSPSMAQPRWNPHAHGIMQCKTVRNKFDMVEKLMVRSRKRVQLQRFLKVIDERAWVFYPKGSVARDSMWRTNSFLCTKTPVL